MTEQELEPVVGVYGLRTFRVSLDGNLLPLTQLSNDWVDGRCVARCAVGDEHTAPETGCTCGIYSFRDLEQLAEQFTAARSLVAVVALEGAAIEGDRGWRSQAGQVVALWIADDALPSHVRAALLERLPGVHEHTNPEELVAAYPGLTCTGGKPTTKAWLREPSTAVSQLFHRWHLMPVANCLFTVAIKTAQLSCLLQLGLVDLAAPGGVLQSWLTATRNLLIYLALNPGVLSAAYTLAILAGAAATIRNTGNAWLSRITWRAASWSLALPLAATFAGLTPPWAAWGGFAAICVLVHGCALLGETTPTRHHNRQDHAVGNAEYVRRAPPRTGRTSDPPIVFG